MGWRGACSIVYRLRVEGDKGAGVGREGTIRQSDGAMVRGLAGSAFCPTGYRVCAPQRGREHRTHIPVLCRQGADRRWYSNEVVAQISPRERSEARTNAYRPTNVYCIFAVHFFCKASQGELPGPLIDRRLQTPPARRRKVRAEPFTCRNCGSPSMIFGYM